MILKSPDFIIPFLINHSTEAIAKMQTTIKKKRYSVPSKTKETNMNSSMELTKIYRTNRKKSSPDKVEKQKPPVRQEKVGKAERQQRLGDELRQKGSSQLQLNLHKSPYIARNRFFKAHSLINHLPAYNYTEEVIQFKQSPPKIESDSPIPGVRFKKKSMFNQSANLLTPQPNEDDYRSEFAGKIKNWRQKKEWNRKRSANVDFIINRKCKNFNDLIGEYRKRLSLPQGARIFIFNSKDQWMKRALGERGWIENVNKQSRAFHLYWSNKVYKQHVFPEQLVNHYQSSDLLTSKAGLHRMLLKYGLTHLQPMTFDLTLQKTQFILYFTKLAFISMLKKLIKKFEFQEDITQTNFEELRAQLIFLKRKSQLKGVIESQLIGVVESCFLLLDGQLHELTTFYIDSVIFKIHSMLQINPIQQELIRILRDFYVLCYQSKLFQKETASGSENIWLSKSKNSSKGAGISLHKDLDQILKHSNRLAQKYVQNPLIFTDPMIKGRKFDIRVWVLLVGNLKAKVYYHQKFYGRLCFESYSLDTINLDNQKKHLTNYSQNKLSFRDDALANSIILPDAIFHLIHRQKFIDFKDKFYENIEAMLSKMAVIFRNQIAVGSPNSFQLFGLDLLIDSSLNLHLLEVNLSAACEERHEALTSMMEDVAHGMLNILEGRVSTTDLRGWKLIK